ncbi:MAG TPA: exodeoxyribonuclease V subunit beta [bacterium]|nr:exodeoxyribonuclease V subunit beta [bacterium]
MQNSSSINWKLRDVHIVEASAGTGKTYNVQSIYARLIIEKNISVDSILVVTFTEAATKELMDRIRTILKNLLTYLKTGQNSVGEDRIENIIEKAIQNMNLSRPTIQDRITTAIKDFDDAAIYTIHGFCNRMLQDAAFETGALFDTELIEDSTDIRNDVLADFYRDNFYNASDFTNKLLQSKKLSLSDLNDFVKNVNNSLDPKFLPENITIDLDTKKIEKKIKKLNSVWDEEDIREQFKGKMKTDYYGNDLNKKIVKIKELIDGYISKNTIGIIEKFTNKTIEKNAYKKVDYEDLPRHRFFNECDELNKYINNFIYSVKLKCYKYYQEQFKREKRQKNIKTYDDMIEEVRQRVNQNPSRLKNYIRKRYNVALVDEFQDTSPAQYDIFKNVFIDGNKPIYFVGDPKQAIYKFRGGDIYTYNRAKKQIPAKNHHNLGKNWRSIPNLVKAFNHLFSNSLGKYPFANKFINYTKVNAHPYDPQKKLSFKGGQEERPLKILFVDKKIGAPEMEEVAAQQTAAKIYELLNSDDYKIGDKENQRKIKPEDIAVLVHKHDHADIMNDELRKWKIPVTVQATGDVYSTEEAHDIMLLLKTINNPRDLKLVKALLSTKLFGLNCQEILDFSADNPEKNKEFEYWLNLFRKCREIWRKNDFLEMIDYLIDEIELKKRLLSLQNGERILTNIEHLIELIHHQEEVGTGGINSINRWFQKKHSQSDSNGDKEKLRLDTDRSAVSVMTIHHSKGLEFPIVFCPFLWSKTVDLNGLPKYHDKNGQYLIDVSKEEGSKNLAKDENLEELMRLLYVAITRAEAQCYLIWGKVLGKQKTAISYLFHRNRIPEKKFRKGEIFEQLKNNINYSDYKPDKKLLGKHEDMIKIQDSEISPSVYERETISLRDTVKEFTGNTEQIWQVSSFSSLVEYETSGFYEYYDYDKVDDSKESEETEEEKFTIFDFPGGIQTGNCWHKLFEELNFQANDQEIDEIIEEKLSLYNLVSKKETHLELNKNKIMAVKQMVQNTLSAELNDQRLQLKKIDEQNKRAEMEFSLSIDQSVDTSQFNKLLTNFGYSANIQNSIPEGMLKGFIDLTFRYKGQYYILDWKSNKIAENYEGYNRSALNQEMEDKNYYLQYLLYTVAFMKYLKSRLGNIDYNSIFGGVYYLFLRGIQGGGESTGIYFDKPDPDLIQEMMKIF